MAGWLVGAGAGWHRRRQAGRRAGAGSRQQAGRQAQAGRASERNPEASSALTDQRNVSNRNRCSFISRSVANRTAVRSR